MRYVIGTFTTWLQSQAGAFSTVDCPRPLVMVRFGLKNPTLWPVILRLPELAASPRELGA